MVKNVEMKNKIRMFKHISDLSDSINKNLYNTYLYELMLLPAVTSIWTFKNRIKKRKTKFINNPTVLHPVYYDYIRNSLDNGDDTVTDIFSQITGELHLRKQGLRSAVA